MKRILVIFLVTLMLFIPGASGQIGSEDTIVFDSSNYYPTITNATAGSYVSIMFFARWNSTGERFTGNDSVIVYVGVSFSNLDQDWQLEADYNQSIGCFSVNFTYSKESLITFYVAEVMINFININFTQTADNITILWHDEVITQPTTFNPFPQLKESDLQFFGLFGGSFAGVAIIVVIYFKRQNDKYEEWQRTTNSRKRKMQDRVKSN